MAVIKSPFIQNKIVRKNNCSWFGNRHRRNALDDFVQHFSADCGQIFTHNSYAPHMSFWDLPMERIAFLFSGRAGAGKDTACGFLQRRFDGERLALATNVKELSAAVLRFVIPELTEDNIHSMLHVSKETPVQLKLDSIRHRRYSVQSFDKHVGGKFLSLLGEDDKDKCDSYLKALRSHFFTTPDANTDSDGMYIHGVWWCLDSNSYEIMMRPFSGSEFVPVTGRRVAQIVGTLAREHVSDTVWIDAVASRAEVSTKRVIYVTDVRFPNEAETLPKRLADLGFVIVHFGIRTIVHHDNTGCVDADTVSHPSEKHNETLPVHEWIGNDGSLWDLQTNVIEAASRQLRKQGIRSVPTEWM